MRVACAEFDRVTQAVVSHRRQLERYIARHPEFRTSLVPVVLLEDAPEAARRMAAASVLVGLGPMAAVAGTLAQLGAEAAMAAGCSEAIVENGGDIYIHAESAVTIGLYAGDNAIAEKLAFRVAPERLPLALCSSSSKMGHSLSLGRCDLATVVAKEAALADAAVTLVCNLIKSEHDLTPVLNDVGATAGIEGIFAVHNGKVGMWGDLPELVRNEDADARRKITRDLRSDFT
ncbi:MAG: UPF0280 family protein [Desulfobulbus sp.]|nr:UPF0280 family protein [Desulfobulbus sp.]